MVLHKPLALALALVSNSVAHADNATVNAPVIEHPHHVYLVGALRISQAWVDVGSRQQNETPAYLLVENRGSSPDRLVGASVEGASSVSLVPGGDAPVGTDLVVPAMGSLKLSPGDAHLEIAGLGGASGRSDVDGTLRFARAGSLHMSFATNAADALKDDQKDPADDRPVDLAH